MITRALGTEEAVEVDTRTDAIEAGDLYLICSDGLTIMVGDEEILDLVTGAGGDLDAAAESLVAAANAAGGEDNVTVVLVDDRGGRAHRSMRPSSRGGCSRDRISPPAAPVAAVSSPASPVRRTGAPAGGRLPALLLIVAALVLAALVLYFGVVR